MKKTYYGEFGGQYVSESLMNTLDELEKAFDEAIHDPKFMEEYEYYLSRVQKSAAHMLSDDAEEMISQMNPLGGQDAKKDDPDARLGAGEEEMNKAMMLYMPLKSLISFGVMNGEQLEGLIATLNKAVED